MKNTPTMRCFIFYQMICLKKDLMGNCPLIASLSNPHLHEKLDMICQAHEAGYELVDGKIVIKVKGCNKR